jgi:hypothetical protein
MVCLVYVGEALRAPQGPRFRKGYGERLSTRDIVPVPPKLRRAFQRARVVVPNGMLPARHNSPGIVANDYPHLIKMREKLKRCALAIDPRANELRDHSFFSYARVSRTCPKHTGPKRACL